MPVREIARENLKSASTKLGTGDKVLFSAGTAGAEQDLLLTSPAGHAIPPHPGPASTLSLISGIPCTGIRSSEVAVVVGGRGGARSTKEGRGAFESSDDERERERDSAGVGIALSVLAVCGEVGEGGPSCVCAAMFSRLVIEDLRARGGGFIDKIYRAVSVPASSKGAKRREWKCFECSGTWLGAPWPLAVPLVPCHAASASGRSSLPLPLPLPHPRVAIEFHLPSALTILLVTVLIRISISILFSLIDILTI